MPSDNRVMMSYVLWAAGGIGLCGLQRMYNGKVSSGVFYLCTFGVFGVGQLLDVFFVPEMAEEHRFRLMSRSGLMPGAQPPQLVAAEVVKPLTKDQLMVKILEAAKGQGGRLTIVQAVMATGLSFDEVEDLLKGMHKKGYAEIENDRHSGVVFYEFPGLDGAPQR
jgi:predicted transcriptional regulator